MRASARRTSTRSSQPDFSLQNSANTPPSRCPAHILTLRQHAKALDVSKAAAQFAEALADGLFDVLIVLLEPLEYFKATTLAEGIAASHTLKEVDRLLRRCSTNKRNLANTAVFDVRTFLTARMRETMSVQDYAALEERSFAVFQKMVEDLNPTVVIACQCATANARNLFVRRLSSTFPPRIDTTDLHIRGRLVPLLRAFHPGVYKAQHMQRWVGLDIKKQEECRRILTAFLEEIFWKAFHMDKNDDVVASRLRQLLDQFRRLRRDHVQMKDSRRTLGL